MQQYAHTSLAAVCSILKRTVFGSIKNWIRMPAFSHESCEAYDNSLNISDSITSPVEWGDITAFLTGLCTGFNTRIRAWQSSYRSASTQQIALLLATINTALIHWNITQTC